MERAQRDTESCGGDMERCKHGIKGCKGRPRSVQRGHREVRGNEGAQKGTERHRGECREWRDMEGHTGGAEEHRGCR